MGIAEDVFGEYKSGESPKKNIVKRFTLTSASGVIVQVITYGAGVSAIIVPDREGNKDHVTLGFDKFDDYQNFNYIGSSIGRHGNRISKGRFILSGQEHQVSINNNSNHNHGGKMGWDKHNWEYSLNENSVVFSHLSFDGDEGYPGTVLAQVKYTLDGEGGLHIDFQAMSTKATPINMTNHCFFNLSGHAGGQTGLKEHVFKLNAENFLPVSTDLIPTGEISSVKGTAYDFLHPTTMGQALLIAPGAGFDHCFCLQDKQRGNLEMAAKIEHPPTGRALEIFTTEPGLQIYTSNFLPKEKGKMVGRNGASYTYQGAFCAEPQNFPNAINEPKFPDCVLEPGNLYKHSIVYKFTVDA